MRELLFASLAAENAAPFYRALVGYLSDALQTSVLLVEDVPWQQRHRWLCQGRVHLGVVCGLQYVLAERDLELLAAPVMRGARYLDQPIYFSDVVVRRDHAAQTFEELRGCRWAVNEPTSHSGYGIVRYALAARGLDGSFFGQVVESGAHERSLELILEGALDASAIDSTVLESEVRRRPWLASQLRVVDTWGPSPIPPLVAARSLSRETRTRYIEALLRMHADPLGAAVLAANEVAWFRRVADSDYEPIRAMARRAELVRFGQAAAAAGG